MTHRSPLLLQVSVCWALVSACDYELNLGESDPTGAGNGGVNGSGGGFGAVAGFSGRSGNGGVLGGAGAAAASGAGGIDSSAGSTGTEGQGPTGSGGLDGDAGSRGATGGRAGNGTSGSGGSAGADASEQCPFPVVTVPEAIFRPACGQSPCHDAANPAGDLDLLTPGVETRLVDQPSSQCSSLLLIDSAASEKSLMLDKVVNAIPICGDPMPLELEARLSAIQIACIREWIELVNQSP